MSPLVEAIIAPVISGGILMIFQKSIEGQISKVSPNEKTTKKVFLISVLTIVIIAFVASFAIINARPENITTNTILPEKNNIEAGKEAGEVLISEIRKMDQENKRNKAEKQASKEKKWAYQIGSGMNNAKDALEVYKKLEHIGGIYIFKEKSRLFFIVQTSRYSEQEFHDNQSTFQKKIDEIPKMSNSAISIVDLNNKCDLTEFVVEGRTGDLKQKKYNDVACYICQ
ncbi:MAG: hypothetical protein AB7O73_01590 [Bacteroidia bacterium]